MYRKFHDRFGTAGMIVAVIALIAALGGTAVASGGLSGAEKKLIKKEAKKWGKKFAKHGPAGPQGPTGANGANGARGEKGDTGVQGPKGDKGDPGQNGTFSTEPLPEGQTLTGVWSVSGTAGSERLASISFPISVEPAPTTLIQFEPGANFSLIAKEGTTHFYPVNPTSPEEIELDEEEWEAACPGSAAAPTAAPGFLCVYLGSKGGTSGTNPSPTTSAYELAHEFGTTVPMQLSGSGELFVKGSWAVTAE